MHIQNLPEWLSRLYGRIENQAMNLFYALLPIFSQIASILGSSTVFVADYVSDSVSKHWVDFYCILIKDLEKRLVNPEVTLFGLT